MEVGAGPELDRLAADPTAAEHLSPLITPAPLVVRWERGGASVPSAWLRSVPTLTVLAGVPEDVAAGVTDAFDVCVTAQPDPPRPWVASSVRGVLDAMAAQPLALVALAALLRDPRPDVWSGIAAESATYAALLGSAEFTAWRAGRPRRPVVDADPVVVLDRDGPRLTLTLNRPDVHNALDAAMRDALVEALQLVDADPTITAVDLRGAGPSFCSGGDLDEFGTVGDPATAHAVRLARHPGWWIHRVRDRLTAKLHGACIGAGAELPAFAARVVAQPETWFSLPEVGMGLVPGAGGTVSIARRIGRHRLAWLAATGARIDAATALAWGLVDAVGVGA